MNIDFTDKVVVVTGAANGIGRATAGLFAAKGARVVAMDLEAPALDETLRSLNGDVGRHMAMCLDLTDRTRVRAAFEHIHSEMGQIDVLVNNVGQSAREQGSDFAVSDPEVWDFVINVSMMTTMMCSRLAVPGMLKRGMGRIVNIASDSALNGDIRVADYVTAKSGVMGFTRAIARELAKDGINVNCVCPGPIKTRMMERLPPETLQAATRSIPVGHLGEPEDIANAVVFLASDAARYITGQSLFVNGGRVFH